MRQHHQLNKLRELESIDWNTIIMNSHNLDEITLKFYEIIWPKFDKSFPLIKVRTSSRDPPFMSPCEPSSESKEKSHTKRKH